MRRWAERTSDAVLPLTVAAALLGLLAPAASAARRADLMLAALVLFTALGIDLWQLEALRARWRTLCVLSLAPFIVLGPLACCATSPSSPRSPRRPPERAPRPSRGSTGSSCSCSEPRPPSGFGAHRAPNGAARGHEHARSPRAVLTTAHAESGVDRHSETHGGGRPDAEGEDAPASAAKSAVVARAPTGAENAPGRLMHVRTHLPLRLRTGVLFHQLELDRDLADGAPPETSPQHALRARQLESRHKRHELAHQVDCILHRAEHSPHWHTAALPVQTAAVQAARSDLESLRDALRHADMPTLRGLALASVLLHADGSPIFDPGSDTSVTAAVRQALSALSGSRRRVARPRRSPGAG